MEQGAHAKRACEILGISLRTIQRWRANQDGIGEDNRHGPLSMPGNALSEEQSGALLSTLNSEEFRDMSPRQIVPRLADQGKYLGSESTMYRLLRKHKLLVHRGRQKPASKAPPREKTATGPNQVWCWDISYLPTSNRGRFYYLYLMLDVFSRKIVGLSVEECESEYLAAELLEACCISENIKPEQLILHSDNGSPMRGSVMLARLDKLGVTASFSRPAVSDDNPFVESLFRTLKYHPTYPQRPFTSLEQAQAWVSQWVYMYNHHHLHSGINYVTPDSRHQGLDKDILLARHEVYQSARARNPERWSGSTRSWKYDDEITLNKKTLSNK